MLQQTPEHILMKANQTKKVVAGLEKALADSFILYLKLQNYHWNVEGELFQPLHDMFQEQYEDLAIANDELAERIRALGAYAPGSFAAFGKLTAIKEETKTPKAKAMVKNIVSDHETIVKTLKACSDVAADAEDKATEDMMIARMQAHDKFAWMLRSLIA